MKIITKEEFASFGIGKRGELNIVAAELDKMEIGQILEVNFTDYDRNIYSAVSIYQKKNGKKFTTNTAKSLRRWFITRTA